MGLSVGVCLFGAGVVQAACPPNIADGETATTVQILNDFESCTVDQGGAINVTAQLAIVGFHNLTITNNGLITLTADTMPAIFAEGLSTVTNNGSINLIGDRLLAVLTNHDTTVINNGTITGNGDDVYGIVAVDDNVLINNGNITLTTEDAAAIIFHADSEVVNNGTITIDGPGNSAIYGDDNNKITNNGTITVSGDASEGIEVDDSHNQISNFGIVTTGGFRGDAIELDGDENSFINKGTLRTSGNEAEGVDANSQDVVSNFGLIETTGTDSDGIDGEDSNTILNEGRILTSGAGAHGIFLDDQNKITNKGTISVTGAGAAAVKLTGDTNQLILGPGSVIIGTIEFDEATNSYEVQNGLNVINSFTGNMPATTNSNGAPQVTDGNKIAVLDISNFSAFDDFFFAKSNGISRQLSSHLGSVRQSETSRAPFWISGQAQYHYIPGQSPTAGVEHFGGTTLIGADHQSTNDQMTTLFVGFGGDRIATRYNAQNTDFLSLIIGGKQIFGFGRSELELGIWGGAMAVHQKRQVANNTSASGIDTASANYTALMFSPELALIHKFGAENSASARASVKYIGGVVDGFSETGAADNLSINARRMDLVDVRFSITQPFKFFTDSDNPINAQASAGIAAQTRLSDGRVNGQMLGQNISFDGARARNAGEIFFGLETTHATSNGFEIDASAHLSARTNGALSFGVDFSFNKQLN
jgi:hypothetical protein